MRRLIHNGNAVDIGGDALLYSTNTQLALTGGVGAALLFRFGLEIQHELGRAASGRAVEVGALFETSLPNLPWRRIFHSIATDEHYHTEPNVVSSILRRCFARCGELGYSRLVTSALGTGYGDLKLAEFARILDSALEDVPACMKEICVVCFDRSEYEKLLTASRYEIEQ